MTSFDTLRLTRRRALALIGAGLPTLAVGRPARAQSLPDCTQEMTVGSWRAVASPYGGYIEQVFDSASDATFRITSPHLPDRELFVMAGSKNGEIWRGEDLLGHTYQSPEGSEFQGDIEAILASLRDGTDLEVGLSPGDELYSLSASGFDSVETLVEPLQAKATEEENALLCDSGGFDGEPCFLTTATCGVLGLPDDCFELRALRQFRDRHMARSAKGRAEIAAYYRTAPAIADRLAAEPGARTLLSLYRRTILPCALLASLGFDRLTHRLYRRMMRRLEERCAAPLTHEAVSGRAAKDSASPERERPLSRPA